MFTSLDISTSGLVAQRARLDAIASNLANLSTTRNEEGDFAPYREKYVTFETHTEIATSSGGVGVRVASVDESGDPPVRTYRPCHPDADSQGYVNLPDINMTEQFVDALQATRAYEANIGVMEISKELGRQTLQIIA